MWLKLPMDKKRLFLEGKQPFSNAYKSYTNYSIAVTVVASTGL